MHSPFQKDKYKVDFVLQASSWIRLSDIAMVLRHLFVLSSFRKSPLVPLASLNCKWFRADLTFRDPCAKYFVRWYIPSLGIPYCSSLWEGYSSLYPHDGNETDVQRISRSGINLQTSKPFVYRKIKHCLWKLYFRRNNPLWLLHVYCFLYVYYFL